MWCHVVLAAFIIGASAPPPRLHDLRITAKVSPASSKTHLLEFEVRNVSSETVRIHSSDLPWDSQENNSLVLVAIEVDSDQRSLPSRREPRGSDVGKLLQLKPGESLFGNVDLGIVFPGLDEALEKHDVCILWAHVIELDDPQRFVEAFGGAWIPWKHYGEVTVDPGPPAPSQPPPN